jgi:hypothetical protein
VTVSESGFAGFGDPQDSRDDHRSSWKSYNPENPDSDCALCGKRINLLVNQGLLDMFQ